MARTECIALAVMLLILTVAPSASFVNDEQAQDHSYYFTDDGSPGSNGVVRSYGYLLPMNDLAMNVDGTAFTVTINFSYELLDTSESAPCEGAIVELRQLSLASFRTVQDGHTDEMGTITFEDVGEGTYLVRIEADDDRWVRVMDDDRFLGSNYYWNTQQFSVTGDRQLEYRISDQTRGAWAAYHDLREGGEWLWGQTGWQRSQVTVIWPDGDWPFSRGDSIHIPSDEYLADAIWRSDITLHEYAHCVHYELRGGSFPDGDGPDPHYIDSESSPGFAFAEGWAQFFERAVHGNAERVDGTSLESTIFADGPFGEGDEGDMDGTIVEGAVANLFWDIYDGVDLSDRPSGNARGDNVDRQFVVLWDIMYRSMPEDVNDIKRAWPVRSVDVRAIFLNARIPMELEPPSNPTSFQSSHEIGTDSLDSTIYLILSGASDDGSGVFGYSILIDESPDSLPDRVMDEKDGAFTTVALSPGAYYVHVRTVDQDGNWAEEVYTIGPFIIAPGATPEDEPLFPEGDTFQALIGLAIVLGAVGLLLLLVVSLDRRKRPAIPPINAARASHDCPYCGRPDSGGTYCSYCGGRLR